MWSTIQSVWNRVKAAVRQTGSAGERFFARMYGGFGYAFFGAWSSDHVEQSRHYKGWVYVAVKSIAEVVAGMSPQVAYIRSEDDILHEKQRCRRLGTLGRKAWKRTKVRLLTSAMRTKSLIDVQPHEQLELLDRDHPLCRLLADPNEPDTAWSFWFRLTMYLELCGSAYVWMVPNGLGLPSELWVIPTHWVFPLSDGERLVSAYEIRPWGTRSSAAGLCRIPAEDMIPISYPSPLTMLDGHATLQAIAEWVDIAESIDAARWSNFREGVWPTLILKLDATYTDPDEEKLRNIQAQIAERYQGDRKVGRPIIVPPGMDVQPWSSASSELAYVQSADQKRDFVLAGFRVSKTIAGITEEVNRASAESALAGFLILTIAPKLKFIGQVMTEHLARRFDPSLVIFWPDGVPDDPAQKLQESTMLMSNGAMTVNELRARYSMEPLAKKQGGEDRITPPGMGAGGQDPLGGMDLSSLLGKKPTADDGKDDDKKPAGPLTGKELANGQRFIAGDFHSNGHTNGKHRQLAIAHSNGKARFGEDAVIAEMRDGIKHLTSTVSMLATAVKVRDDNGQEHAADGRFGSGGSSKPKKPAKPKDEPDGPSTGKPPWPGVTPERQTQTLAAAESMGLDQHEFSRRVHEEITRNLEGRRANPAAYSPASPEAIADNAVIDTVREMQIQQSQAEAKKFQEMVAANLGKDVPPPAKYGGSMAQVQVVSKRPVEKVQEMTNRILGREVKLQDVASLVGAPDNAQVSITPGREAGQMTVRVKHPDYTAKRTIHRKPDGSLVIHNDEFWMNENAQGQGIGSEVFARQIENAIEMGVDRIECHAAKENPRDPGKPHNGYYTWPRFGYDQSIESIKVWHPQQADKILEKYPHAKLVSDIMATPEGRDWWKENGSDLHMAQFDLKPGSRSMKIFNAYMDERSKKRLSKSIAAPQDPSNNGDYVEEILLSPDEEAALDAAWERAASWKDEPAKE